MIDLRLQLERERRLRMHLEEKLRSVKSQMYPNDRLREIAQHIQLAYQSHEVSAVQNMKNFSPSFTEAVNLQWPEHNRKIHYLPQRGVSVIPISDLKKSRFAVLLPYKH